MTNLSAHSGHGVPSNSVLLPDALEDANIEKAVEASRRKPSVPAANWNIIRAASGLAASSY